MGNISKILSLFNALTQTKDIVELRQIVLSEFDSYVEISQKYSQAIEQITTLQEQIKKYETWEQERKNYESYTTSIGATVYRKKNTEEFFCPNCYETKMVAVHLQPSSLSEHWNYHKNYKFCPNCKNTFRVEF